jgi:hypothetical protein
MSTIRGDATAKPKDYVRELKVGGHDMVEDQWRGEMDAVTTLLLNNQVSVNPGLVVTEAIAVSGSPTFITASKPIATLIGVTPYVGASGIQAALTVTTAAAADVDQVANPGKINLTGAPADGWVVAVYLAA